MVGEAGATVLLLSDGRVNEGMVDAERLGAVATQAQQQRITTTAIGLGLGYDEQILASLARGGGGALHFAEEADTAAALISGEVDGLLQQVAQAVSLTVTMTPHVQGLAVLNDLPVQPVAGGVMVELGSFLAGETRRLMLRMRVPGIPALGLAQVAELTLTSVSLPELVQSTITIPVHVNVVPGDQAAGRMADPTVRSEALFVEAQTSKRQAAELLRSNDVTGATRMLRDTARRLTGAAAGLPQDAAAELLSEVDLITDLAREAETGSVERSRRSGLTDATMKSRMRMRRMAANFVVLVRPDGERLELEGWRLARLEGMVRAAGLELHPWDRNSTDVARAIADGVGPNHRLFPFFDAAASAGGFSGQRGR